MTKGRVLVAMSGGVDSSVAAALLVEAGYECVGVHALLYSEESTGEARRVADTLRIPFHIVDLRDDFKRTVIDSFADAYAQGLTPNPCIVCNKRIKFGAMAEIAGEFDCSFVATGHYARVLYDEEQERWCLAQGRDHCKDQSYALYTLSQEQLARALFPLGDYSKDQVRAMALKRGLEVAHRPESQDICFVVDDDYRRFLRELRPGSVRPGPIIDREGRHLGTHSGLCFYTVGQRKGLGISSPRPLYVLELDAKRNALIVGEAEDVFSQRLVASSVNWVSVRGLSEPMSVTGRIRYRVPPASAVIHQLPTGEVLTQFSQPQRAITPGQSVVWYLDDLVVGGGIIAKAGQEADSVDE